MLTNAQEGVQAEAKPRPLMIAFGKEEEKLAVMKNPRKLKNAHKPLDKISVRNDLTREEQQ